ncbi:MAG: tetratricopeptide repeat protein [Gemmatimonadales bacterium]|nr:tetratricopeptide repeat protein [Gemmatimonadales bacterium]
MRRSLLPLLLALGAGCAYFNGMYNANRLANQAEKAEREGRPFEADGLWAQAAVRAESVLVHHPKSKWADDAMVHRGRAYKKRGDCATAISSLREAIYTSPDPALVEQAALLLGECQLELGSFFAAEAALRPALESGDSLTRRRARLNQALALTRAGRYEAALDIYEDLEDSTSDQTRILALSGAGSLGHAVALADSLMARNDSTVEWDSLLAIMRRRDLAAASALTDRLIEIPGVDAEIKARWLLEDGERLLQVDSARAKERLRMASETGEEGTDAGSRARLALARLQLAAVREVSELSTLEPSLVELREFGRSAGFQAGQLLTEIERVRQADSVRADTPQGDLETFLAAERTRDALGAPALASRMFQRLVETWPESPYAPKAVLALADLQPVLAPALRQLLMAGYAESPYVAVLSGEDLPAYRSLEDSLRSFIALRSAPPEPERARPAQPARRQPVRDRRLDGDEEEEEP